MNRIDRQIAKMVKETKFAENAGFMEQICNMADDLVKQAQDAHAARRKYRHLAPKKYIPASLFVLAVAAYPVKASVDYVNKRLLAMPEEEKDRLRTMVYENDSQDDTAESEAIRYSRNFSESEQSRYHTLWSKYEDGAFPKCALPISAKLPTANNTTVCYYPKENYLYLPSRELTDEEFLEIIDFYHKVDYSLRTSKITQTYKKDAEKKDATPPSNALPEDDAISLAASYMQKMYGISATDMERHLTCEAGDYKVTFETDTTCYSVYMQADCGMLKGISLEDDNFIYYQDNLEANEDRIRSRGKEAKDIAMRLLGKDAMITDGYAQYKINTDGKVPHGSVVFLFDLDSGDQLRVPYSMAEDALWGATLDKGAAGYQEENVRDGEKRIYLNLNLD